MKYVGFVGMKRFWFLNTKQQHFRNRFGGAYQMFIVQNKLGCIHEKIIPFWLCMRVCLFRKSFLYHRSHLSSVCQINNVCHVLSSHWISVRCAEWAGKKATELRFNLAIAIHGKREKEKKNHRFTTSTRRNRRERKLYSDASFKSQTTQKAAARTAKDVINSEWDKTEKQENKEKKKIEDEGKTEIGTHTKAHAKPHTFT